MRSDEELAAYLASDMRNDERQAFEESLVTDPESRREILDQQRLSSALRALLAEEDGGMTRAILAGVRTQRSEVVSRGIRAAVKSARRPAWLTPLQVAAAIVLLAVLGRLFLVSSAPSNMPAYAATVTRQIAAEWEGEAPGVGHRFALQETLNLKRGAAELEFANGATVLLEGPANLRLISPDEAFLASGRLRAVVPERAVGFTIRGEGFAAVDLGTEFGVIAGRDPEVHVFEGKVEFQAQRRYLLQKAVGLRLDENRVQGIPAQRDKFVGERQLAAMQASAAIDVHPAALVHYDFETDGNSVANRVPATHCPAEIVGAAHSGGRWPRNRALEFTEAGQRAEFEMPAPLKSLTFLAWVQVDYLPERQGGLLMGSSDVPGDVHWYLYQDGSVGFAIVGNDGQWHPMHSRPVFDGGNHGEWKFLAVTYDGETGAVSHYVDGKADASWQVPVGVPITPGETAIGNWALRPGAAVSASRSFIYGASDYDRLFPGRIDEIAIFSAVLTPTEIEALHEGGRP